MPEVLLPCARCHKEKPESQFGICKRNTGRLGRASYCNSCMNQITRDWHRAEANGEKTPKKRFHKAIVMRLLKPHKSATPREATRGHCRKDLPKLISAPSITKITQGVNP